MELDTWMGSYKIRAFPWIDGKRIYFNIQYYMPGQSTEKPPAREKTVYITDNANGKNLVFNLTHSLINHIENMKIKDGTEITLTA